MALDFLTTYHNVSLDELKSTSTPCNSALGCSKGRERYSADKSLSSGQALTKSIVMRSIVIYPVDSAIHLSNSRVFT